MTLGITSLLLIFLLYGFLSLVFPIKIPTTKDPEMLKKYAFSLGKEAKAEGRKSMSTLDKNRIISFAGVSSWQDLDVMTLYSEFNRGLNT